MRAEKQILLDEIKEKIESSKGFLITRYQKLSAHKARGFRETIGNAKGEFEVVKKRIFIKALSQSSLGLKVDNYEGDIGVLFAHEDLSQLSKVALKFSEENENAIEFLGAVLEGNLLNKEEAEAFAKLPGIQELRAQFLATIACPLQNIVSVFDALLTSVAYGVEERSKGLEKA